MRRCQVSADAGSVPCCGSVACPVKLIVLPTRQVVPAVGVSITAVGAWLPGVMITVSVSVAPSVSVTVSFAV